MNSCDDIDFTQFENEVLIVGISEVQAFQRLADDTLMLGGELTAISIENLDIRVEMDYVRQPRKEKSSQFHLLDWLFSSAHACSIAYGGDIESRVIEVDLFSDAALGDSYSAGDSLQSAFMIEGLRVDEINYGYDYANGYVDDALLIETFTIERPIIANVRYSLRADDAQTQALIPERTALHQFTFSIALESGETFVATSQPVLITGRD